MGTTLKKLGEAELEIMQVGLGQWKSCNFKLYFKRITGTKKLAAFHINDIIDKAG